MIITVTMNPAIDKTLEIENLTVGRVHRVKRVIQDAGGKGINVSKCVKALGGETIATGFLGGTAGKMIAGALDDMGIRNSFVRIEGETRTNSKLVDIKNDNMVTEINEPGPEVTAKDLEALVEKLEFYASPSSIFTFSGSVPASVDPEIYGFLTKKLKKLSSTVFVDASGPLLAEAIKAKPFLIKPNIAELAKYFSVPKNTITEEQIIAFATSIMEQGVNTVAVSRGSEGAIFVDETSIYKTNGMQIYSFSTVGAGDAMLAALAYGLDHEIPYEDCLRLSIANSAGACTTHGTKPPSRALVDELIKDVSIERLK